MTDKVVLLGVKHLTHELSVIESGFFSDRFQIKGQRRTNKGMFFQPYNNADECFLNVKHVLYPSIVVASLILNPISAATGLAAAGILTGLAALARLCIAEKDKDTSFIYQAATAFINDFCQAIIDLCVLPLSALILLTRGASTVFGSKNANEAEFTHPGLVPVF
jgi:hypothetical protein